MKTRYKDSNLKWDNFHIRNLAPGDVIVAISRQDGDVVIPYLIAHEEHSGVYNLVNVKTGELIGGDEDLDKLISENVDEDAFELRHTFVPTFDVLIK